MQAGVDGYRTMTHGATLLPESTQEPATSEWKRRRPHHSALRARVSGRSPRVDLPRGRVEGAYRRTRSPLVAVALARILRWALDESDGWLENHMAARSRFPKDVVRLRIACVDHNKSCAAALLGMGDDPAGALGLFGEFRRGCGASPTAEPRVRKHWARSSISGCRR